MHGNNRYTYEVRSRVPKVARRSKGATAALIVVTLVLAFGLCVGGGFLGAKLANDKNSGAVTEKTTVIYVDSSDRATKVNATGSEMTAAEVVLAVRDGVVEISAGSVKNGSGGYVNVSNGSGVIITEDGYILTAYHVVEGAEQVTITLRDGSSFQAEWVKGDAITDIAVVKINASTPSAVNKGDSAVLDQGQNVVSVSNPTGALGGSVSGGLVSAIGRTAIVDGEEMDNLIRTDIVVSNGCSGGGLFNMYGALVGILNAKGADGVGYAIPSETAYGIGVDLIENGYVKGRVDLGLVEFTEVSGSDTKSAGIYVKKISANAGKNKTLLGLKQNDYVISVGGKNVRTIAEWNAVLNAHSVGETLEVVYVRDNTQYTASMLLLQRQDADK